MKGVSSGQRALRINQDIKQVNIYSDNQLDCGAWMGVHNEIVPDRKTSWDVCDSDMRHISSLSISCHQPYTEHISCSTPSPHSNSGGKYMRPSSTPLNNNGKQIGKQQWKYSIPPLFAGLRSFPSRESRKSANY